MFGWLIVVFVPVRPAHAESRDDRSVRAAYVFNLIKYVEWPSQPEKELMIGFIGDAATGEVMETMLNGRTSDGACHSRSAVSVGRRTASVQSFVCC